MPKIKIAAYPMKIAWADPAENLRNVASVMTHLQPGTDILVLPELFSTGFMQDKEVILSLAEGTTGNTIEQLKSLSRNSGVAIAGSFLCRVGDKIYNRAFFVEPSGEETYYDKRHLFSLSLEHTLFTPGHTLPPVVRFRGWNIALSVCYDLRFPVWCRNRKHSYDIMLVPANWPTSRGYAWKHLIIARAIENQAIYVGANRGGSDDFGDYDNLTYIADGLGKLYPADQPVINSTTDSIGSINNTDRNTSEANSLIYGTFDKSELIKIREKLPFGNDADDYSIECEVR